MNAARKSARADLPPAKLLNCTPEEYHKDPCAVPSLSASTAHLMVSESPLHAWTRHPKFGSVESDDELVEAEDDDTKAKDEGTLIHKLLLGKGTEIVVVEADSFRTKAAREIRDEARASGKLPVIAAKFEAISTAANRLRAKCREYGFEFGGDSEVGIEWYETGATGPVVCRSMLDHVYVNDGVIFDVKKIRSANPKKIARAFVEHGYDIQEHAYTRAVEGLNPKLTGRVEMTFLFLEIDPPYAVVPIEPDGALREVGKQRWRRAVTLWEHCLAENRWPSYVNSKLVLEAPPYVITEHLGKEWAE